jgi:hypothetical protein
MKINVRYADDANVNYDFVHILEYLELYQLSETFATGDIKNFKINNQFGPVAGETNITVMYWANVFRVPESAVGPDEYLIVNCYTEAGNILTDNFANALKKFKCKKLFLLVNGYWDKDIFKYDLDYEIMYWPFWLKSYSASILNPQDINFWQLSQHNKQTLTPTKDFNLLMGKYRKERHMMAVKMNEAGLLDHGIVSYKNQHKPSPDFASYSWNNGFDQFLLKSYNIASVPDLSKPLPDDVQLLKDRWPFAGTFDKFQSPYGTRVIRSLDHVLPIKLTLLTKFSVVVETSVFNNNFHITEKLIRPIILKHPFLAFSSKGFLKYLQQIGFKTFSPIVDESYDDIEDIEERCAAIVAETKRLVETDSIVNNKDEIEAICQHNYQVLCSMHTYFSDCVSEINKQLLINN